jgi:small-conductance mechanosensitive channel
MRTGAGGSGASSGCHAVAVGRGAIPWLAALILALRLVVPAVLLPALLLPSLVQPALAETAAPASAVSTDAGGASTGDATAKALSDLLEAAKKEGATILVVAPPAPATATEPEPPQTFMRSLMHVRQAIFNIVDNVPRHVAALPETIETARQAGFFERLRHSLLIAVLALAAGCAATIAWRRYGQRRLDALPIAHPQDRADRLSYLLLRALGMAIGIALFLAVGGAVVVALAEDVHQARRVLQVFLLPVAAVLFVRLLLSIGLAPGAAEFRLLPLDDGAAARVSVLLETTAGIAAVFAAIVWWMVTMEFPRSIYRLTGLVGIGVVAVMLSAAVFTLKRRLDVARLAGAIESYEIPAERVIARWWHVVVVTGIVVASATAVLRLLLDLERPVEPVFGPFAVVAVAMLAHAVMLLLIDRTLKVPNAVAVPPLPGAPPVGAPPSGAPFHVTPAGQPEALSVAPDASGPPRLDPSGEEAVAQAVGSEVAFERASILHGLAEHAALIITLVGATVGILWTWGVDVLDADGIVSHAAGFVLIVVVAMLAYRAVRLWLDREIAVEWMAAQEEEARGASASVVGANTRLGTLLSIVRNFLLFAILGLATMMALSQLGVPITPLFAGAGVVGLAIGFGAQSLIKDMFSGMFYLIDDAFRLGEYIDIGSAKGTVEKISIRSFQLRHQNGPLNTVPFGEIQRLTNYSRDWVIVKLPVRVTYDTPVSKLNRVVKALSKELLADEDVGHMFLEPLKSQGVYQMEDSAMVVRLKFKTRPDDQFVVKRVVYAKIRETFEREGIHFAHRNVTVFIGNPEALRPGEPPPGAAMAAPPAQPGVVPAAAMAAAAAAAGPLFDDEDGLPLDDPSEAR